MTSLITFFRSLHSDRSGATAIEYGLIIALITLALVATLGTFSDTIQTWFGQLGTQVNATLPGAGG